MNSRSLPMLGIVCLGLLTACKPDNQTEATAAKASVERDPREEMPLTLGENEILVSSLATLPEGWNRRFEGDVTIFTHFPTNVEIHQSLWRRDLTLREKLTELRDKVLSGPHSKEIMEMTIDGSRQTSRTGMFECKITEDSGRESRTQVFVRINNNPRAGILFSLHGPESFFTGDSYDNALAIIEHTNLESERFDSK